jgi:hypothetical protein
MGDDIVRLHFFRVMIVYRPLERALFARLPVDQSRKLDKSHSRKDTSFITLVVS